MKTYAFAFLFLATGALFGQTKKKIDHHTYDEWNTISSISQSASGQLITYEIKPYEADGNLYIQKIDNSLKKIVPRATKASISEQEQHVVFIIKPHSDTLRNLELRKVKKDKFPKDSLAIYSLANDSTQYYPEIKSYQLSEESEWLAFLSHSDLREPCKEKKCKIFSKKKKCSNYKTTGSTLQIINLSNGHSQQIHGVTDYLLSNNGTSLTYIQSKKGKVDTLSAYNINLSSWESKSLLQNQLSIKKIVEDKECEQLAFYSSTDTNKLKNYALYYWKTNLDEATLIVDSTTTDMTSGHTVSTNSTPNFSWDGTKLFFGTADIVKQEAKDTLLDREKAKLDIWGSNDLRIQPQQLSEARRDKRKTYKSVYLINESKFVALENETIRSIKPLDHGNSNFATGYATDPYKRTISWEYPWKRDLYITNLTTGQHKLIKKAHAHSATLSPSGDYFLWYEGPDSNWYSKNVSTNDSINLTQNLNDNFTEESNGYPVEMGSQGYAGWTKINNIEYFLIYSTNDIWALCPSDETKTFSLTSGLGKLNSEKLRLNRFDQDSTYLTIETNFIHGIDSLSKQESYYQINKTGKEYELNPVIRSNHKFIHLTKAKNTGQLLFRRMSFTDYPEIESSTTNFNAIQTLTSTNPQQADYNWGTVEMIDWTTFNGTKTRGLLYKPEDFDSTKSYPMITYFYETYTESIHAYYAPKPTASIVYATEYVSNGYIIFIPDISYEIGHPAKSAYNSIVSGTDYLTNKYSWIDTNRLGLQGQSWGGYQTAQLITMTDKYHAAMAGAPVSNMFSAYGGIRWKSGLSRMFQYEHGQSRIGSTIWEKPELYIENSPIFGLPNVKTPLLIMHNDGDGSVPWYQGIELYMGLRRLNQPVWLLNYNGDEHNLLRPANRLDLSIRMRQFFDYYLLETDIPDWMDNGIPALDKGTSNGYVLKKPSED